MQAMAAAGMIASYMTPDGHFLAAPFMPPMQPQGATKLGLGVTDPSVYAHKLFVGQVPFDATEYDLWQLFAPCGDILELTILRKSGMSKGCAFLTYATRRQAIDAITAHHGRDLTDSKRLVVKFADHKPAPASAPAPAVSES